MLVGLFRNRAVFTSKGGIMELRSMLMKCQHANEVESIVQNPRNAENLDFENLCTGIFKLAKTQKRRDLSSIDQLLKLCETRESKPHQLAFLCSTIANTRLYAQIPDFVLQRIKHSNLKDFAPASLVNILWSFAKLPSHNAQSSVKLITQELGALNRDYSKFSVQDLTTASWALAKLGSNNDSVIVMSRLAKELATREFSAFSIQSMANFMWASAQSTQKDDELIILLCEELASRNSNAFTAQDISNLLWSLATMNINSLASRTLVDALCQELATKRNLFEFPPQAISNIYWSCAVLNKPLRIPHRSEHKLNLTKLEPRVLATMLWAMTKDNNNSNNNAAFSHKLCSELSQREYIGNAQDISSILYSCAKLDVVNVQLLSRACDLILTQRAFITNQSITNICWALGKLRYREDKVLSLLAETMLERRLADFPLQAISSMMLGLANLHFKHKPLCQAVAPHVVRQDDLNEQSMLNLAWAFAVIDVLHLPPIQTFFQHKGEVVNVSSAEAKQQLAQTKLAWDQTNPNVTSALLDRFVVQDNIPALHVEPSFVQLGIFNMLRDALLEHHHHQCESEAFVCNGILSVDIFVPNKRVVIEIDGPQHFYIYPLPTKRCGSTLFKHRLLERAGFKVKSIRLHHFTKLTHADQVKYIDALVKQIVK